MSRLEFMKELAKLLEDLPREEKIEILKYYNGYFDDAGKENEAAIIEELESPAKVAASVKAGMDENLAEHMEFTEKGVDDEKTVHEYEESRAFGGGFNGSEDRNTDTYTYSRYDSPYRRQEPKGDSAWKAIAVVLLLVVTFPFWITLLGVGLGLFGGCIGLLAGMCALVVGGLAGCFGGGIGCMVNGFVRLLSSPINGMLSISTGILLFGLGLLCALLCGWTFRLVFGKALPLLFRTLGNLFRWAGGLLGRIRA